MDFQKRVAMWSGPDLDRNSSQLIHFSKAILYQDFKRSSLLMYLFDNQLVLCSTMTPGDLNSTCDFKRSSLVYFRRFDLAFLNFRVENNNFIFTTQMDENGNSGFLSGNRPSKDLIESGSVHAVGYNRPLPALPNVQNNDQVEIHVKGRNSRQEWRYLLSLEIGFAKIKYKHRTAALVPENGIGPLTQESLAEDICNFIRNLKQKTT